MQADTLRAIANAVRAGEVPAAHPGTFKAFSDNAVALNPSLDEGSLARVLAALTADDLPMLERAAQACEDGERAWLAFKVVSDPEVAVDSEDTDVVGIRGKGEGSADGENRIFLVIDPADNRDTAEIVAGHEYSRRDRFQILDVTRGPRMHNDQYAGLTWVCEPLFKESRVVILGASAVGLELAQVARRVGFSTMVLDDDAEFLAEELLPDSSRILVDWESLPDWQLGELDYVCVLTRGHMHDPEAIAWGNYSGVMTPIQQAGRRLRGHDGASHQERACFRHRRGALWRDARATRGDAHAHRHPLRRKDRPRAVHLNPRRTHPSPPRNE